MVEPLAGHRDGALDAVDLRGEGLRHCVGGLADAIVGGLQRRLDRAGLAVDVADDPGAGRGKRAVDRSDLAVDVTDELLAGRVETLLGKVDGGVDQRDLRGDAGTDFRADLAEALIRGFKRGVDGAELAG